MQNPSITATSDSYAHLRDSPRCTHSQRHLQTNHRQTPDTQRPTVRSTQTEAPSDSHRLTQGDAHGYTDSHPETCTNTHRATCRDTTGHTVRQTLRSHTNPQRRSNGHTHSRVPTLLTDTLEFTHMGTHRVRRHTHSLSDLHRHAQHFPPVMALSALIHTYTQTLANTVRLMQSPLHTDPQRETLRHTSVGTHMLTSRPSHIRGLLAKIMWRHSHTQT